MARRAKAGAAERIRELEAQVAAAQDGVGLGVEAVELQADVGAAVLHPPGEDRVPAEAEAVGDDDDVGGEGARKAKGKAEETKGSG